MLVLNGERKESDVMLTPWGKYSVECIIAAINKKVYECSPDSVVGMITSPVVCYRESADIIADALCSFCQDSFDAKDFLHVEDEGRVKDVLRTFCARLREESKDYDILIVITHLALFQKVVHDAIVTLDYFDEVLWALPDCHQEGLQSDPLRLRQQLELVTTE